MIAETQKRNPNITNGIYELDGTNSVANKALGWI